MLEEVEMPIVVKYSMSESDGVKDEGVAGRSRSLHHGPHPLSQQVIV
jgi:hypothetical protein